jgi:hypothetical protein
VEKISGASKSDATKIGLETGESMTIGLYIDTTDNDPTNGLGAGTTVTLSDSDELLSTITINADADESSDTDWTG